MAWSTVERVKELGGLNHPHDYLAFRLDSELDLENLIERSIATASAWIQIKIDPAIYATSDVNIQEVLTVGESYIALHFLAPALKARKVIGTHFSFESEESDRYAELIDVEWMALAQELLGTWITIPVEDESFARPVMRVGPVIDRNVFPAESVEEEWVEALDRARSIPVNLP